MSEPHKSFLKFDQMTIKKSIIYKMTAEDPNSFSAAFNRLVFLYAYHHLGAVLFISVSMLRIPNKFQAPLSFPLSEACKALRLMAKPLSRYSI